MSTAVQQWISCVDCIALAAGDPAEMQPRGAREWAHGRPLAGEDWLPRDMDDTTRRRLKPVNLLKFTSSLLVLLAIRPLRTKWRDVYDTMVVAARTCAATCCY